MLCVLSARCYMYLHSQNNGAILTVPLKRKLQPLFIFLVRRIWFLLKRVLFLARITELASLVKIIQTFVFTV